MIHGSVPYQLTQDIASLFSAPGRPVTLFNSGPSYAYLSTTEKHDPTAAIPLAVGASVQWDADKPCYGSCDPAATTTVTANDNSGAINDPSALAQAIIGQGLASLIAVQISLNAPRPTPVIFDVPAYPTHVATTTIIPSTYVDGVLQPSSVYIVPAGYRLVLSTAVLLASKAAAGVDEAIFRIRSNSGGLTYGLLRAKLSGGDHSELVTPLNPAIVVPEGIGITIRDESNINTMVADVTLYGGLYTT